MSDTQAAMREFRFLDEKRTSTGLTPAEAERWQALAEELGVDVSQAQPSAQPAGAPPAPGYYGPDGQWYPYAPQGYDPAVWGGAPGAWPGYYPPPQGYYDPNTGAWYPYPQPPTYYDPNTGAYYPMPPGYGYPQPWGPPPGPQGYEQNQAWPPQPQAYPQQWPGQPAWPAQPQPEPYPTDAGDWPQQPPPPAEGSGAEGEAPQQAPELGHEPAATAPFGSPGPEAPHEVSSDEVMEVRDEEVVEIPALRAHPEPAPVPADPMADLRLALSIDDDLPEPVQQPLEAEQPRGSGLVADIAPTPPSPPQAQQPPAPPPAPAPSPPSLLGDLTPEPTAKFDLPTLPKAPGGWTPLLDLPPPPEDLTAEPPLAGDADQLIPEEPPRATDTSPVLEVPSPQPTPPEHAAFGTSSASSVQRYDHRTGEPISSGTITPVETPAVVLPELGRPTSGDDPTAVASLPELDELDDLPMTDAEPDAPPASAFDELALPPDASPIPSFTPVPSSAPSREAVFDSSWHENPQAGAEKPAPPVAEGWGVPEPQLEAEPALAPEAGAPLELAVVTEFVPWTEQPSSAEALPFEAELGEFEVESASPAELATGVVGEATSLFDDQPLELATNAELIPAPTQPGVGELFTRSDAPLDLADDVVEGEVIQGEPVFPLDPLDEASDLDVEDLMRPSASPPVFNPYRAPAPVPLPVPTFAAQPLVAPGPAFRPAAPAPPSAQAPTLSPPGAISAAAAANRMGSLPSPVPLDPPQPSAPGLAPIRGEETPVPVPGEHRVILHTMEGGVKRGAIKDANLSAAQVVLLTNPGVSESVPRERVKAIFFMLAPGSRAPAPDGLKVRVTFRDGRQVAGFSKDHRSGAAGFFVVPADARTNTERIFIYRHGVTSVSIEG
jgi:hypothetical protein